ncbi:MAG: ABC transporter permease [Clostridia bacterium]|nr:ABC transporter permease [Clostridia bacterium]
MVKYILKRIISAIPTLIIVSVLIFALVRFIPGSPAQVMLGDDATPDEIAAMEEKLGLNQPIVFQYVKWMAGVIKGDFGDSIYYHEPVLKIITERLEPTWILVVYSILIGTVLGMFFGIIAALYRNRFLDKLCMVLSILGISMPGFWIGMNLIILLAVKNPIFPSVGYMSIADGGLSQTLYFLTLPAFAMGIQRSASIARVTRSSMLDVLGDDYIRTARAKGLKKTKIVFVHALKNAANPILTQVGISVAHLMGGSVVIEKLFNVPGIGRLAYDSISRRDYPAIQGHVLFVAVVYVVINLIIDLLYKVNDPRIQYN